MAQNNRRSHRRRKSIRLRGWDYRHAGAYFVTICTHNRACYFGQIVDGRMRLNDWGQIVVRELIETEKKRDNVMLGEFICMPNHVHVIFWILLINELSPVGAQRAAPQLVQRAGPLRPTDYNLPDEFPHVKSGSLGAIVRGFKSPVTKQINDLRQEKYPPVWQRGYYDRIIRNERELNAIRQYIRANPQNWKQDHEWDEGLDDYLNDYM